MPKFDEKSEKVGLLEDRVQNSHKKHNQLSKRDKLNIINSLIPVDALLTFKNNSSPIRKNLGKTLAIFIRKYMKHQSMTTVKPNFQKLVFNPVKQKLVNFLNGVHQLAKYALGTAGRTLIEQFIYAKMTPYPKKLINQAHSEGGTYKQTVKQL